MEDGQQLSMKEQLVPSNVVPFAEYMVAMFLKLLIMAREGKKVGADDPQYTTFQKLCDHFGEECPIGFFVGKKDTRMTVRYTPSDFRLLYVGDNLVPCPSGRDPPLHPSNIVMIANRKTAEIYWACVKNFEDGALLVLNRAENYLITAHILLNNNKHTNTTPGAFMSLYKIMQARINAVSKMSSEQLQEHFAAIDNGEEPPTSLGGMLIPSSLFFETEKNLANMATTYPRGLENPFRIMPKKQPALSPSKSSASSSSSSSSKSKKKRSPKKKEKKEQKPAKQELASSSLSLSQTVGDIRGLQHADISNLLKRLLGEREGPRKEYWKVFASQLDKSLKPPKGHLADKPSKAQKTTESIYPEDVRAMKCADRLILGLFQVMAGENPALAKQLRQCTDAMHKKANTNPEDHKYNLLVNALGHHYLGDTSEPCRTTTTRNLYLIFYCLANQIIPRVVEIVEQVCNKQMADHCDQLAQATVDKFNEYVTSHRNEIVELRERLNQSDKQLSELIKKSEEQTAQLSDELAKCKVENTNLRERNAELEKQLSALVKQLNKPAKQASSSSSSRKRKAGDDDSEEEEEEVPRSKKQKVKQSAITKTLTKTIGESEESDGEEEGSSSCSDDDDGALVSDSE